MAMNAAFLSRVCPLRTTSSCQVPGAVTVGMLHAASSDPVPGFERRGSFIAQSRHRGLVGGVAAAGADGDHLDGVGVLVVGS